MFVYSRLNDEQLKDIQRYEQETGVKLIALSEIHVKPKEVKVDKVEEIHQLEKALGVCLIAVQ